MSIPISVKFVFWFSKKLPFKTFQNYMKEVLQFYEGQQPAQEEKA